MKIKYKNLYCFGFVLALVHSTSFIICHGKSQWHILNGRESGAYTNFNFPSKLWRKEKALAISIHLSIYLSIYLYIAIEQWFGIRMVHKIKWKRSRKMWADQRMSFSERWEDAICFPSWVNKHKDGKMPSGINNHGISLCHSTDLDHPFTNSNQGY